ncbi:unnamed protein product [Sphagnum jensenii]
MLTLRRESCGQDFCRRSSSSSSSVTDTRSVGFFNRRVDDRYAAGIGNDSIGRALCNWHFSLPRRTRKKKQLQVPLRVSSTSEQTDR